MPLHPTLPRAALLILAAGCAAPERDVILISIDGTPPALVQEEWDDLPELSALAEAGGYRDMWLQGATDTKASHARMLTGYGADVTGVIRGNDYQVIPEGMTLQERLREAWGRQIHLSFVASKPNMLGIDDGDPFLRAGAVSDVAYNVISTAAESGQEMRDALDDAGRRARFAFFHFSGPDDYGHADGERSEAQREALREVDAEIGALREALETEGRWANTLVYVATDHGFEDDTNHHRSGSHATWLISNDPDLIAVSGTEGLIERIPWTILERYGLGLGADDPAPEAGSLLD